MTLTIGLTQLKRKKRKDGRIPIYIRVTEDRKSRYRSTGIAVKRNKWAPKNKRVSSSHNRSEQLNVELDQKERDVKELRDKLYREDRLNLDNLMAEIDKSNKDEKENPNRLLTRAKAYHDSLEGTERYHEWKKMGVVLNNLKDFLGDDAISVTDVSAAFIEDFQDYLLNNVGNNPNTVRRKLRTFKGMFLRMLKSKEIEHDPFATVDKVSKIPAERVKLSLKQIKEIEILSLKKDSDLWHVRNYFLFSFYNAGIRFSDMCRLTWKNLIDGRLKYNMQKTGGKKSIRQLDSMYRILFQYVDQPGRYLILKNWKPDETYYLRQPNNHVKIFEPIVRKYAASHRNDYIFPLLERHYDNPAEIRKKIGSKNAQVNLKLKDLAQKTGIEASVSFHVSRHSFANYANKKGMDIYSISKALAHSNLKTTQQYLDGFDEEKLDKSMEELYE